MVSPLAWSMPPAWCFAPPRACCVVCMSMFMYRCSSDSVYHLPLCFAHAAVDVVVFVEVDQRVALPDQVAGAQRLVAAHPGVADARVRIRLAPQCVVVRRPARRLWVKARAPCACAHACAQAARRSTSQHIAARRRVPSQRGTRGTSYRSRAVRGCGRTQSRQPRAACGCCSWAGTRGTRTGTREGGSKCGLAAAGRPPPRPRATPGAQTAAAPPALRCPAARAARATRARRAPARLRQGGEAGRRGEGGGAQAREMTRGAGGWPPTSRSGTRTAARNPALAAACLRPAASGPPAPALAVARSHAPVAVRARPGTPAALSCRPLPLAQPSPPAPATRAPAGRCMTPGV